MQKREVSVLEKRKIAFICVHNSCRSQIAEALGKKFLSNKYDFYSAGTEVKDKINQDAVRIMKDLYGIDMEQSQYPKTIDKIPKVNTLISMGCGVKCPLVYKDFDADWGLKDPTGCSDEIFINVIKKIENLVKKL